MIVPQAVVFDLGKVLLDFDYGIAAGKMATRASHTARELQAIIDQSPLLLSYETGHLTSEQFFQEVCRATGFCGLWEEFSAMFSDIFAPIEPMIGLHQKLRSKGLPTYIFSNTNPISIAFIRRQYPFFQHFDGYIFSYEHGAMKPDPLIYAAVERVTGKTGPEILYIDDRGENIEAGRARGWQVIQHVTPEQTITAVEKLKLI